MENLTIRSGAMAIVAVSLALGACAPDPTVDGNDVAPSDVASVQSPLSDPFPPTPGGAQTAVASTGSAVLSVWTAKDSAGVNQIVGQLFDNVGARVTPVVVYTSGPDQKGSPALAVGGDGTILLTYTDAFMNTNDLDIWGLVISPVGNALPGGPFHVNFDGTISVENSVAALSSASGGKWLVTYRDAPNSPGSLQSVKANIVTTSGSFTNPAQSVGANNTIFAQSFVTPLEPHAVAGINTAGTERILISLGPSRYTFLDPATLSAGTIETVPANGSVSDKVVAYNAKTKSFALAWRDETTSQRLIRYKTYSNGCEHESCADLEDFRSMKTGTGTGDVKELYTPYLAALDVGFVVIAGREATATVLAQFPYYNNIAFVWFDGHGAFGFSSETSLSFCSVAHGVPGTNFRGTAISNFKGDNRTFIMYNAFCPGQNKLQGSRLIGYFGVNRFNVSD